MTEYTFTSKDPLGLLSVLGEASNEFDNEGAPVSKALIDELRDQLRSQVKPVVEEPTEFGSIVRASSDKCEPQMWSPIPRTGDHWWHSETGKLERWRDLDVDEVLRFGVGDEEAHAASFTEGFDAACNEILKALRKLRVNAITGERQDAYDKAIAAVERELAES